MKIYLVSTRSFFKENNVDYAMAFDPYSDDDLKIFTNKDEALKEVNDRLYYYENCFNTTKVEFKNEDEITVIFTNTEANTRYIVSIQPKEI